MLPMQFYDLARIIHEERIREAQARRPEWMYEAALNARAQKRAARRAQIRFSLAQVLRRLAAAIESKAATSQAAHPL